MHKDYKMTKQTKRMLALMPCKDKEMRSQFKRMMIEAEVAAERSRRGALKSKTRDKDEQ